jgi:plasmid stabilization system protein ParE
MGYLALSRTAVYDLEDIRIYSEENWGDEVARRYMGCLEDALRRLKEHPELLRDIPAFSKSLKFYRVERHFLVCSLVGKNVYVLTVKHGAMDLPDRIEEIEPHLVREAAILHEEFIASRRGKN